MKQYTKGEWAWQLFGDTYMLAAQHGRREIIIGAVEAPVFKYPVPAMNDNGIMKVVDKDHPNAKLIAAAPEMIEALKEAQVFLGHIEGRVGEQAFNTIWDIVDNAIKKATE